MADWFTHVRIGVSEVREPTPEDTDETISINKVDIEEWNGPRNGKIGRNPDNHQDLWYIAAAYWPKHFNTMGAPV